MSQMDTDEGGWDVPMCSSALICAHLQMMPFALSHFRAFAVSISFALCPWPVGCARAPGAAGAARPAPAPTVVPFVDVAAAAGVRFRHSNGARGEHAFVETTGSGCALFDYDNDGRLDLLLLQAGPLPG